MYRIVEQILGLSTLNDLYRREWLPRRDGRRFSEAALEILDVTLDVTLAPGAQLPTSGGIIVVANHPHGALDGLALIALLSRARADVRVLGNHLLGRIPELRDSCYLIDPFGRRASVRANAAALRGAVRWARGGGALVVFPAGEVSHVREDGAMVDAEWRPTVARLAERAGAAVVPVFVHGGNSRLFHLAGCVHPLLRTALLPRELLRQRGRQVSLTIGRPIPAARLLALPGDSSRIGYLRMRTYALGGQPGSHGRGVSSQEPVAAAVAAELLASEIDGLSPRRRLLSAGDFDVICAPGPELPHALREIGRLRELSFRRVGEGTGRACDLDRFDLRYWHVFVWNRVRREVAGAYRIGATDELLAADGVRGLYTRTLFRYSRRFLRSMGPALELGRSFVRQEYQRDYGTLMLLWKGIGHFVASRPRYRMLLGAVSISADYRPASRDLLVALLSANRYQSPLRPMVRPLRSVRPKRLTGWPGDSHQAWLSPDAVAEIVAEIEGDGKGIPVLLRQYLKLNARLLAFSVDPDFANVVDALVVVDLTQVPQPILARYLGRDGATGFLATHCASAGALPASEPAVVHA